MTRTEFLAAYCDWKKQQRGDVPSTEEFKAHTQDRQFAAIIWRKHKARLQMISFEVWRKEQEKR